jgi:hypothetical protein
MNTKKSGGPPVRGATATTKTHPHHEVDPNTESTGPVGHGEPVTAGDGGYAAWIGDLEREQAEDDKVRDAVHRLIARATCITGGVLPVGSPEWFAAPLAVQLASVAIVGQQYLPETPMRQASKAMSGALDWRAAAGRESFAELQRRRSTPITPVRCQDPGCGRVQYVEHPLPERFLCDRCERTQRAGAAA